MTFDDIYYVAALIEYIGRQTKNTRRNVVQCIGKDGIAILMKNAPVNHCLQMRQVADEVIADYHIMPGSYDSVQDCRYDVPPYKAIGKDYARLIVDTEQDPANYPLALYKAFLSPLSDKLSDFNSSFFFAPRSEIAYYYLTQYSKS